MVKSTDRIGVLQLNVRHFIIEEYDKPLELVRWCDERDISVVVLCETFLCAPDCKGWHKNKCKRPVLIPGWTWVGRPRREREGGRVGFLIKQTISFRPRDDLQVQGAEDL